MEEVPDNYIARKVEDEKARRLMEYTVDPAWKISDISTSKLYSFISLYMTGKDVAFEISCATLFEMYWKSFYFNLYCMQLNVKW